MFLRIGMGSDSEFYNMALFTSAMKEGKEE